LLINYKYFHNLSMIIQITHMSPTQALYPLKFEPLFKYRMWGGQKLRTHLNKSITNPQIGESWEISGVANDETVVADGWLKGFTLQLLIEKFTAQFLGHSVFQKFNNEFPLLIKFIDAKTPLSIQVHPSDEIAKKRHNSFGKNEMWYIMEADKDAEIILGFKGSTDKNTYQQHLENHTVLELMHHQKVKKGDAFYIPTGRIHAIGAGILLAEIQQTSNITYRIYDYDRVDQATGETRDLHNDLAMDVLDFNSQDSYGTIYENKENTPNQLIHSPYFKSDYLNLTQNINKDFSQRDSFTIFICMEGKSNLVYKGVTYRLILGETILIPAVIDSVNIETNGAKLLEVYM